MYIAYAIDFKNAGGISTIGDGSLSVTLTNLKIDSIFVRISRSYPY
jgi:hypothetical protein